MRLLKLNKIKTKSKNKYGAIKKEVDKIVFASRKEANRYLVLKQLLRCNKITDLQLQVKYTFVLNDKKIGIAYIADFTYTDVETELFVVEDVKGYKTDIYKLKKKLMKAFFDIDILET